MKIDKIRISCAALSSIIIDDKYLLSLNKRSMKADKIVYTPIGGALEYYPTGKIFLDSINAEYERMSPDLRLHIKIDELPKFTQWFNKNIDRESSISRELIEEMVDEDNIFPSLNMNDFTSTYIKTESMIITLNGILTNFFFEVYSIKFTDEKNIELKTYINNQKNHKSLILVSKSEIEQEHTTDNLLIGNNSKVLL